MKCLNDPWSLYRELHHRAISRIKDGCDGDALRLLSILFWSGPRDYKNRRTWIPFEPPVVWPEDPIV